VGVDGVSRLSQAAPARKEALPAKVLIAGPSGSGKTYSGLLAAEVFAGAEGKVLVIDTEHRRASLYADLAQFDSLEWHPPYSPLELAETLLEAAQKYAVVLVDSLTHFWSHEGGTLSVVDAASARSRGNTFSGWKEGTPVQQALYEAILAAPCHVVCTVRSKTDYVLETDSRGKQVPRKVGMAPVQRDGLEYEFDAQFDLDFEHAAIVGKTRCPAIADKVYPKGKTKEWARTLLDWLNDGAAPPVVPCPVDGCTRAARTKADHVPHLLADHGWVQDGKRVHDPGAPTAPGTDEGVDAAASAPPSSDTRPPGDAQGSAASPAAGPASPITAAQRARLMAMCHERGLAERQARLDWGADTIGRPLESFADLTRQEAGVLLDALEKAPMAPTLEGVDG
jgi:hypothetical protein